MKIFWIISTITILVTMMVLNPVDSSASPGGILSNFFSSLTAPEYPGQKTEEILPPVIKEHHEHFWVKEPHFEVQNTESFGKQRQQILHQHVAHQKILHNNHVHKHILNEHTDHKVHTHNIHNEIEHIHEITKQQNHIHKPPIIHQYQHHQNKVTNEHKTKHTQGSTVTYAHQNIMTNVHAPPIYQKEWSILKWFKAWMA